MNADNVLNRWESVKSQYSMKDAEIDRIHDYTASRFYDDQIAGSLLRDEPRYGTIDGTHRAINPRLFNAVQDATSLLAQYPAIDVPPKGETEKDLKHAEKLKKLLYATYDASGGADYFHNKCFNLIHDGWTIALAEPVIDEDRIGVFTYDARYCYPVFKLGSKRFLRELYIAWKVSPEAIKDTYPNYEQDSDQEDESVEILVYWDTKNKMVFADGQLLAGVKHDYGFVPAMMFPCMLTPDGMGIGYVHQNAGLNIMQNNTMNLTYQWLEETVRADTVVYTDDDLEPPSWWGRRLIWKLPLGSKAERMNPAANNFSEAYRIMGLMDDMMGAGSGGAARSSQREGMYVSEGGQKALAQPFADRLESIQRIMAERLMELNEMILRLWEKHFGDEKINIAGRIGGMGGKTFNLQMKGKAIAGYYRTVVTFLPPMNQNSRMIQGLQLKESNSISNYTFQTDYNEGIDPEFENRKITEEFIMEAARQAEAARMLAEAQMPPQQDIGAMMGGGDPDKIELQQTQLEKGRTTPTAEGMFAGSDMSMPSTGGPNMSMTPMPQGAPLPDNVTPMPGLSQLQSIPEDVGDALDELTEIADAIRAIGKLRGKVYLTGKVVYIGSIDVDAGDKLEIAISNPLDKATITNALAEIKDALMFRKVKDAPSEPHVDVSPGTEGYDIGGQEYASTKQGAVPPDAPAIPAGPDNQAAALPLS